MLTFDRSRPLLFRASSTDPVRSFKNRDIAHPHGNVISADAFSTGVIKSGTDYAVYNLGLDKKVKPMEGIDLAFYQGRSKYHTKYDSIPGANGAKQSLWLMLNTAHGSARSLLNDDETHVKDGPGNGDSPVYFDGMSVLHLFV